MVFRPTYRSLSVSAQLGRMPPAVQNCTESYATSCSYLFSAYIPPFFFPAKYLICGLGGRIGKVDVVKDLGQHSNISVDMRRRSAGLGAFER